MTSRITKVFFLIVSVLCLSCSDKSKSTIKAIISSDEKKPSLNIQKTNKKAKEALSFCKQKKFNTDFCILIDMSLHSGVNRFFIYDFNEKKITKKYLVGHGCGNYIWSWAQSKDNPDFSNEDNSHLSSLGKYKIGERGVSEWGIKVKYLMLGLEETNNNSLKRAIVFHSWEKMDDNEIFPKGSPEGWGCPTVSNNALREIDPILKNSSTPVLMWIYN
jgi:hypothetical protein